MSRGVVIGFLNRFFLSRIVNRGSDSEVKSKAMSIFKGSADLESIREFVIPHKDGLSQQRSIKGMFTSDPATIEAAKSVLKSAEINKSAADSGFFQDNIFSQPPKSSHEQGSIKIKISTLDDFPDLRQKYISQRQNKVMVCVGGPAAEDQVVIAGLIENIKRRLDDILYLTRDYKESNVNHAAKQSHARHGNALNADSSLTGHALLPKIIMRSLLGTSIKEVTDPDFRKIDVEFSLDPSKIKIYFGNEFNWLKQEYKKIKGELTEHDVNRLESLLSQEILKIVDSAIRDKTGYGIIGGNVSSRDNPSSVHVTFTKSNDAEVKRENEEFKKVGIFAEELSSEEIKFLFPDKNIFSAYKYPGDMHLKFNTHEVNSNFAKKSGVKWLEGKEVDRILLAWDDKANESRLAGVVTKNGEYFYASSMHFTGGYKAQYEFDRQSKSRFESGYWLRNVVNFVEDIFNLQNPISNETTVSTGVSINAVFRKSDQIKKIIEKFGSTGEIAVTNSHWTMIAQNDNFVVMRMTGGGNTGSEEYKPSYFLNVLANTRRIFGDDLIGILSTYGCPRSINARNTTEFAKISKDVVISYGKGGTGNTKRHAEAAIGLMMIGFQDEVVEYFNNFRNEKQEFIGDDLKNIYKHFMDMNFLHDNIERVNRRMGFDKSISLEEMLFVAILLGAATYVLKGLLKNKEQANSNLDKPSLSIAPDSSLKIINNTNKEEHSI